MCRRAVGPLTGPEQLYPKLLDPLWPNGFRSGRRRSTRVFMMPVDNLAWRRSMRFVRKFDFVYKEVALDCKLVGVVVI